MGAIRRSKTKRRTRDLDQVHTDIRCAKHFLQCKDERNAEDLPGLGQWYCMECAKWFESENNLIQHRRGKNHKRRVRLLKNEPYSQKEAEAAVGLRTDNGRRHSFDQSKYCKVDSMPTVGQEMEIEPKGDAR